MNHTARYIFLTLFFCIITFSLHSMEVETGIECNKKPTIRGQIFITSEYWGNSARYSPKEHHERLCQIGIQSWIQCPLINVTVLVTNNDGSVTNWINNIPQAISTFETKESNNNNKFVETDYYTTTKLLGKKFPCLLPAVYLYRAKTDTVLSFTVDGYPTELLCINTINDHDPQLQNKPFEECYSYVMRNFITNAICNESAAEQPLIELGIIEKVGRKQYRHGENGFKSIEKLLFDQVHEKNRSLYFLLCMLQSPCR